MTSTGGSGWRDLAVQSSSRRVMLPSPGRPRIGAIRGARPTPARPADRRPSVLSTRLLLQSSLPTALCDTRVTPRRIRDSAGANYDELVRVSGEERGKGRRTGPHSGGVPGPRGTGRTPRNPARTRDFGQQKTGLEGRFLSEYWWSQGGSNSRPRHCERRALPAELWPRKRRQIITGGGGCDKFPPPGMMFRQREDQGSSKLSENNGAAVQRLNGRIAPPLPAATT